MVTIVVGSEKVKRELNNKDREMISGLPIEEESHQGFL